MSEKKLLIINLVDQLKVKSELSWSQIYNYMNLSKDAFEGKYRRFPERVTTYTVDEVIKLISVLNTGVERCEIFECLLLWGWCELSISRMPDLIKLFEVEEVSFHTVLQAYLEYSHMLDKWFDPSYQIPLKVKLRISQLNDILEHQSSGDISEKSISPNNNLEKLRYLQNQVRLGIDIDTSFQESETIFRASLLSRQEQSTYQLTRALMYFWNDNIALGKQELKKSVHNGEKIKADINYANATALKDGYFKRGDDAFATLQARLKSQNFANKFNMLCFVQTARACIAIEQANYHKANTLFIEAYESAKKIENVTKQKERLAQIFRNRAACAYYMDDYLQSRLWCQTAYDLMNEVDLLSSKLEIDYLLTLTQNQIAEGYINLANISLNDALAKARKSNLKSELQKLELEEARLSIKLGHIQEAHQTIKQLLQTEIEQGQSGMYGLAKLLYHYLSVSLLYEQQYSTSIWKHDIVGCVRLNKDLFKDEWFETLRRRYTRGGMRLQEETHREIVEIFHKFVTS